MACWSTCKPTSNLAGCALHIHLVNSSCRPVPRLDDVCTKDPFPYVLQEQHFLILIFILHNLRAEFTDIHFESSPLPYFLCNHGAGQLYSKLCAELVMITCNILQVVYHRNAGGGIQMPVMITQPLWVYSQIVKITSMSLMKHFLLTSVENVKGYGRWEEELLQT